ncbi:MAG: hypothetical protein E7271_07190 [Lachnospiraceae bacterium]|jgi:hypothetical protein|nr:hypothetical protein [Lachnospiraceae bacterium]
MTLLITVLAACVATIVWYKITPNSTMGIGFLVLTYWGASLMWLCDAIFEYRELGAEFFTPSVEDMINDIFLGFSVVALGLIIWLVRLMIKDPEGKLKQNLSK